MDECTGPAVAAWLRTFGHDVYSVYDESPGLPDDDVLEKARTEFRILITNDRDFGVKVYRERQSHRGVIFLRLRDERAVVKIAVLAKLFGAYSDRLEDSFVVASESQVRFAKS